MGDTTAQDESAYRMQEHTYTEDEEGGENMTLHSLYYQNMLDMKTCDDKCDNIIWCPSSRQSPSSKHPTSIHFFGNVSQWFILSRVFGTKMNQSLLGSGDTMFRRQHS